MNRSPSIQFLAAMSSRYPYRGGRNQWRRGYSDRPYNGGRGQFVSGDSHFRSVRDSNSGFRQGNFSYQAVPPPPHYNQNQQFRQPPPNNRNHHFRQPRPFHQNQSVRPRTQRPLDYRNWQYAKVPPPPDCERFVVLSYNILADYLAIGHRSKLYFHIPRHILDWGWRKKSILFELGLWSADIMCFQEVDRFQDLEQELRPRGYNGIWKMRTGNAIDGCAIFWRMSRFKLLYEEGIEFSKLGMRDNVAQICVLELLSQNRSADTAAPPTSSAQSNIVVVCNIHVLFNPRRGEFKLGQVRTLLDRAHAVSKTWNDAPVILCGDFNCTPKSPLYNFISEQKLDLSEVDRDKVSGQASAEICAPRQHNPNPRAEHAQGPQAAPWVVDTGDVGARQSDPLPSMQKNHEIGKTEITPHVSIMSPSHCTEKGLSASDKASVIVPGGNTESAQSMVDDSAAETASAFFVPIDKCKESTSSLANECKLSSDHDRISDEVNKSFPPGATHSEDKSVVSEMGHKEKANASSHPIHGSSGVHSDPYINTFKGGTNNDDSVVFPMCNDHSSRTDIYPIPGSLAKNPSQFSADDKPASSSTPNEFQVLSGYTSIDIVVDKLEDFSLEKIEEAVGVGDSIEEDDSTFLSALHENEDNFPAGSDLDHSSKELGDEVLDDVSPELDTEAVNVERATYDPALWTPMEISTATGNPDNTFLEHPLTLKSTYAEVEDNAGTRDSNGEPIVTSYNRCFLGTVDYIWCSEGLQTVKVLAPIPKPALQWTAGFPTKKWGSDHIALASEVAFVKTQE